MPHTPAPSRTRWRELSWERGRVPTASEGHKSTKLGAVVLTMEFPHRNAASNVDHIRLALVKQFLREGMSHTVLRRLDSN